MSPLNNVIGSFLRDFFLPGNCTKTITNNYSKYGHTTTGHKPAVVLTTLIQNSKVSKTLVKH